MGVLCRAAKGPILACKVACTCTVRLSPAKIVSMANKPKPGAWVPDRLYARDRAVTDPNLIAPQIPTTGVQLSRLQFAPLTGCAAS